MIKTLTIHRQFDNHFRLWFDNLTIIAGAGLTGCPENAAFPMTETPPPGKSFSESDDCDEAVILNKIMMTIIQLYNYDMDADDAVHLFHLPNTFASVIAIDDCFIHISDFDIFSNTMRPSS